MNKKTLIYYHHDMDGIASATIVMMKFPNSEAYPVQYGMDLSLIKKKYKDYDQLVLVDFSFPKEFMDEIVEVYKEDFIWIDHHKSSKEKLDYLWNSKLKGIRSIDKAACELTWDYFYDSKETPRIIKNVGDRDIWKFDLENTKFIYEALNLYVDNPDDFYKVMMDYDYNKLVSLGLNLYESKMRRVERNFNKGFAGKFEDHECYFVNTPNDISDTCNYAIGQGYDMCINFHYSDKSWVFNLRSNNKIDVSNIAKKYSGGGHAKAAGFSYKGDIKHIIKGV